MSNAIMNIASAPVPAFLQKFQQGGNALNSQLAALASGFPTISIKGKVFAVVRDGVRQVSCSTIYSFPYHCYGNERLAFRCPLL